MDTEILEKIKITFPFKIEIVEEQLTEKWKKMGVKNELFILVRPDNYMAFIFDQFDETKIKSYLKKYFILN